MRQTREIVLGIVVFAWAAAVPVAAGQSSEEILGTAPAKRPAFSFLRFNEDWSVLADWPEDQPRDPWDPIKYLPLNDDGSAWASFGGSARLRVEHWENFGFGAADDDDDTFLLRRLLMHADVHVGEHLRGFVEGKSAGSTERDLPGGRRTLDVDSLDLQQGFVDLAIPLEDRSTVTLRAGRQALKFGKQRLVSPLAWSNTLRSWDGVSAITAVRGWTVTGFWTQFAPVRKHEFNDPDAQTQFFGAYATGDLGDGRTTLDLYFLGLDRDDPVTFNGTTGDEERYTIGGRLAGRLGESRFDYDFEGAYQFGEVGSGDVDAFMIGSQLGWRPEIDWGSPRAHLGFDYGSGDSSTGGDVETFNQLFPLGHAYLGYIDAIGRQNIIDVNAGLSFKPAEKLTFNVAGHLFWRDDTSDAVYNAGGGVLRPGSAGSDREVGQEIDVTLKWAVDRHVVVELGYSHFFPGDFIDESGASDDVDFVYAHVEYRF